MGEGMSGAFTCEESKLGRWEEVERRWERWHHSVIGLYGGEGKTGLVSHEDVGVLDETL